MERNKILQGALIGVVLLVTPVFNVVNGATSDCLVLKVNLSIGAKDATSAGSVILLQHFLHKTGFLLSEPTGYFGPLTFKAVQEFQKSQSIPAIGAVGPLTRAAIEKASCSKTIHNSLPVGNGTNKLVSPNIPEQEHTQPTPQGLPYRSTAFFDWRGTWGEVSSTKKGSLLVNASKVTNDAEAIFANGNEWSNYRYTASFVVSNGDVTLISRYVNKDNFLACTFYRNAVTIKERVAGETRTVAVGVVREFDPSTYFNLNTSFSMRVQGNSVGCSMIGIADNVTYTNVNPVLSRGTVGIYTWHDVQGVATLELKSVIVEKI